MTLLGLKLAVFAALFAWWLARDRVDYRPVLSPPRWRLMLPVALALVAALAAGFSAVVPAVALGVFGLAVLCSYPLGAWKLSPIGIEGGQGRSMRWDDVSGMRLRCAAVELTARDGSRLLLPRDLDGMVTFSRVARTALPAPVLSRPQVQWLLSHLETGGDLRGRLPVSVEPGERLSLLI